MECHLTLQTDDDKILVPSTRAQEVTVIPSAEQNIFSPKVELVAGPDEEKEASVIEYFPCWFVNSLLVFRVPRPGPARPPPLLVDAGDS